MNNVIVELDSLRMDAKKDPILKNRLLETRTAEDPMLAFCKVACEVGHPITVGELFAIGQEYSDNQCKSMNGGNCSPYEAFGDAYEYFLDSL